MNKDDQIKEITHKIITNQSAIAKLNADNYEAELTVRKLRQQLHHNDILIHSLKEENEKLKEKLKQLESS